MGWINYYELCVRDLEQELEVLGWGLGVDNLSLVLLVSVLLTMVCICLVFIISVARCIECIGWENYYRIYFVRKKVNRFVYLRVQNFYMQERVQKGRSFKVLRNQRR